MNQATARQNTVSAPSPRPEGQEPVFRNLRRSREDGAIANLREAQGRGGPLDDGSDFVAASSLRAKRRWREQVDDAGAAWSRLSESDLQQLEDHQRTLAELIQERYGVSAHEAERQVMAFIEDHVSSSL